MGVREWFAGLKKRFGKKQEMLDEGKLDPKSKDFEVNLLKELGVSQQMLDFTRVKEDVLEHIEETAIEQGLITEKQSIADIKPEDVLRLIEEEQKKISINDDEITLWNFDNNINTSKYVQHYKINDQNQIEKRDVSLYEQINNEDGKKETSYSIRDATFDNKNYKISENIYDTISERYDYSKLINEKSNEIFKGKLYEKFPMSTAGIPQKNDYEVEIMNRYNNAELNPEIQSEDQLQVNILKELGVPEKLLQDKFVIETCWRKLSESEEFKSESDVWNFIDRVRNEGKITTNDNGVLIQSSTRGNDGHSAKYTDLFMLDSKEDKIYYRMMSESQKLNNQEQVEGYYVIRDFELPESGEQKEIQKIDNTEIIFDYNKYGSVKEKMEQIINLDTSEEQNQEGKTSAEEFREALKRDYEKQQKKTIDIFKGLGISEKLTDDPQIYASLQDSLSVELSREQIDFENQDTNQIVATLKDNMSWQIDENRVLIYNNDSENGRYGAVEFATLDDGKIQKSNLAIRETNIDGKYGYDFISNSTITQNGKPVKNIEKTNHETSQNKLSKDKIMISLNSLTSLPQNEWQQIVENDSVQENNLNKDEEIINA